MQARDILESVLRGDDLDLATVREAMTRIMRGEWDPVVISAYLVALRAKEESLEEIAGSAQIMREFAVAVSAPEAIDIVGTGGDGANSVNISTIAAFLLRGAGIPVAKHGNRSVSSRCGSADVLELLGAVVDLDPAAVQQVFDECGFCFMFAPRHHPSMKHVAPVRKALGIRTMFNILGPLTNPASVRRGLYGVFDKELIELYAYVLKFLGATDVLVVHGEHAGLGMDEASATGVTHYARLAGGEISTGFFMPGQLGVPAGLTVDIRGGDPEQNATSAHAIVAGQDHPAAAAVYINAGLAAWASGHLADVGQAFDFGREAASSGKAVAALESYVAATRKFAAQ